MSETDDRPRAINSSVRIVVATRSNTRIPAGHAVNVGYHWTFGTREEVEAALRRQANAQASRN